MAWQKLSADAGRHIAVCSVSRNSISRRIADWNADQSAADSLHDSHSDRRIHFYRCGLGGASVGDHPRNNIWTLPDCFERRRQLLGRCPTGLCHHS